MIIGKPGGEISKIVKPEDLAGSDSFNISEVTGSGNPQVLGFASIVDGLGFADWSEVNGILIRNVSGSLTIDPSSDQEIGIEVWQDGNQVPTRQRMTQQSISSSLGLTTFSFSAQYKGFSLANFNANTASLAVDVYRTGTGGGVSEGEKFLKVWCW